MPGAGGCDCERTVKHDGYISPTTNTRLHLKGNDIINYHPQATSKLGKGQGYVVARIEPWCRDTYGRLFEQAPALLARALDALVALDAGGQNEVEPLIADIKATLGLPQETP